MKRIWNNYNKWEDFKNGLFSSSSGVDLDLNEFKNFITSDAFYDNGLLMMHEWPYCSDHNLSDTKCNRRSYLGQAVCNFVFKYTAKETVKMWQALSQVDMVNANNIADKIIRYYEENIYDKNKAQEVGNEKLS